MYISLCLLAGASPGMPEPCLGMPDAPRSSWLVIAPARRPGTTGPKLQAIRSCWLAALLGGCGRRALLLLLTSVALVLLAWWMWWMLLSACGCLEDGVSDNAAAPAP